MRRAPAPSEGTLFAAIVRTVNSSDPPARVQKIDIALGFLGFFAFFSVVQTAASTLRGVPSAPEALVSALFVGLGYLLLRRREALCRRIASNDAPTPSLTTDRPARSRR